MALPEWRVSCVENIDFSAPLKFYRNQPRTVTTKVHLRSEPDDVIADCSLSGIRTLVGKSEPQITNHFSGTVRLTKNQRVQDLPSLAVVAPLEPTVEAHNIYKVYFHGPAYQVLARAWRDGERMIGQMSASLPPNHAPAHLQTVLNPRILELCLQTAGLWEITVKNRLGLPQHIDRIRLWNAALEPDSTLYAIVTPDERHGVFNAEVIDSKGRRFCEMQGYRTAVLMNDVDASPLQWLQAAA